VHSPFVYKLLTKCFYDKTDYEAYKQLAEYRKRLTDNDLVIFVQDFGAGSRIFKSNARQISKVAKTAGITKKRAKLLFRLVKYLEPNSILEIGTSLGLATSALSFARPSSAITTIEGCKETSEVAREQFDFFKLKTIKLIHSEFDKALQSSEITSQTFDLIYIDGNHQKEATLSYFETFLPKVTNDTIMVFDDIHWSEEMTQAWETIKEHSKVTVSIDTFFWGFACFRNEQNKEHFTIRV